MEGGDHNLFYVSIPGFVKKPTKCSGYQNSGHRYKIGICQIWRRVTQLWHPMCACMLIKLNYSFWFVQDIYENGSTGTGLEHTFANTVCVMQSHNSIRSVDKLRYQLVALLVLLWLFNGQVAAVYKVWRIIFHIHPTRTVCCNSSLKTEVCQQLEIYWWMKAIFLSQKQW